VQGGLLGCLMVLKDSRYRDIVKAEVSKCLEGKVTMWMSKIE